MSSLTNKYRPKTFDDFVGNEWNAEILKGMIKNNRIPSTVLLAGKYGNGKTSLARVLAKAVNCKNPNNGNPCNLCKSCKTIDNFTNMDVIELDAGTNSGVSASRQLVEDSNFEPMLSNYKVYIIDEVHGLSNQAFNSLLKSLEEPKNKVIFILCTTEYNKIPATIKSRSQKYIFRNVEPHKIKNLLMSIRDKEGLPVPDTYIEIISENCDGSLRSAISVLEQAEYISTIDNLLNVLGVINKTYINSIITNIFDNNVTPIFDLVSDKQLDIKILLEEIQKELIVRLSENKIYEINKAIKIIEKISDCKVALKEGYLQTVTFQSLIYSLITPQQKKKALEWEI